MQSNQTSRKRPAPGTSPPPNQPMPQSNMYNNNIANVGAASTLSDLDDDQFLAWGSNNGMNMNTYQDPNNAYYSGMGTGMNDLGMPLGNSGQMSNQLVRRNPNQQMTQAAQPFWTDFGGTANNHMENFEEDDEDLEQKAAVAKKEAMSKRPPKQIPPFIQKLSSYLDREENTHLIRWSDDGNSFLVLDEDEFAKKLIPNLFKHNNYASFVRQLNMYGFHKKVGLSDNSMRASEQKTKTPSEYYNPYFKRNRPELLWLIQKPKNETSSTKKKKGKGGQDEVDSGDEDRKDFDTAVETAPTSNRTTDMVPREEYQTLKREVESLQRSQKQITAMLSRLRDENHRYIQQASHLVANHERHESSINAILTFLATFYNRSLQGQGNPFANAIPANQPQSGVVEYEDSPSSAQAPTPRPPPRKPLALLPAPITEVPRASSVSDSAANSPRPTSGEPQQQQGNKSRASQHLAPSNAQQNAFSPSGASSTRSSPTPGVKESPGTPNLVNQYPDASNSTGDQTANNQAARNNNEMMNVINNVNANANATAPNLDFNSALRHFENVDGNGPLTAEQRNNMISLMASNSGTDAPLGASANTPDYSNLQLTPTTSNTNNNANPYANLSDNFQQHREHLEMLHRLQSEQDSKVQDLAGRLQPLSPSGSIPGLPDFGSSYGSNPGDFDLNNFMNTDYFADFPPGSGGENNNNNSNNDGSGFGDLNFGDGGAFQNSNIDGEDDGSLFGGDGEDNDGGEDDPTAYNDGTGTDDANNNDNDNFDGGGGGRVVGSVATSTAGANSPAATVEEIADEDDEDEGDEETMHDRRKRRRVGR